MFGNVPQPITYGLVVFAALFFAGWIPGMGGSFVPNPVFSALMGILAGGCFWILAKFIRKP